MTFDERVARLVPLTAYGPDYVRGVGENLRDAQRFHASDPDGFSAEYFLIRAELLAKLITFEEFEVAKARADGRLV